MLLEFKEYQALGGTAPPDNYDKLEQDAEDIINPITNNYYLLMDIDKDVDTERVRFFKKAMELQINFEHEIGASTPYAMSEKDVKSVTVDGTTVQKGTTPISFAKAGIYKLALEYLYMTGLVYRGVPYA